jgi:hypothetical protein
MAENSEFSAFATFTLPDLPQPLAQGAVVAVKMGRMPARQDGLLLMSYC